MNKRIIDLTASVLKSSLNDLAKESLIIDKAGLVYLTTSIIGQIILKFANNFALQVVLSFIKTIHKQEDTISLIKEQLSVIVREPLKTGLDILKKAYDIEGGNNHQQAYRITRLRDALNKFDTALSLANENEKGFVVLLRGLVTYEIPGAELECKLHLGEFVLLCSGEMETYKKEMSNLDTVIKDLEKIWDGRPKVTKPRGIGGGGFISMAIGEAYASQQEELFELNSKRRARNEMETKIAQLSNSILAINRIIQSI